VTVLQYDYKAAARKRRKKEDIVMKKKVSFKMAAVCVIVGSLGVGAIVCITLSLVTGKTAPYLPLGLAMGAIGNMVGAIVNRMRKEGKFDGSGKDRSAS